MLEVKHLQVSYGESVIVNDVSLSAPAGQIVCLIGPNGVGKTTLMKAIMGTLKARKGSIVFEGQEVTHQSTHMRAQSGIGYVPQGRGIFNHLTVYENLLMGFEAAADKRVRVERIEAMYALFPVLKEMRKRVAGTLSGGQQQQLAIARALIRKPKLLLLDEPTEGIQPSIMIQIEEIILELHRQGEITILLVEQFIDFALNVADYYYVMQTGQVVTQGRIDEFNHEVVRDYLAF
ncbi:MAG: urea ABC transporter ATP-binding subunit UrtE [Chloroflexi bacterium]|nr:urea ABC transporter ATP-binding subunit UrtE [Chloroflexota bacterium]